MNSLQKFTTNKGVRTGAAIGLIGGFLFSKMYLKDTGKESFKTAITAAVILSLLGYGITSMHEPKKQA